MPAYLNSLNNFILRSNLPADKDPRKYGKLELVKKKSKSLSTHVWDVTSADGGFCTKKCINNKHQFYLTFGILKWILATAYSYL